MTDEMQMSVGVRFCSKCENNLRCEECTYKEKYKVLLEKHEYVLGEAKRAKSELDNLQRDIIPRLEHSLERANKYGLDLEKKNQELKTRIKQLEEENSLLFSR